MTLLVKILGDDPRLGIKKDEVYEAHYAGYDHGKIVLVKRVPDGYDPECSQYCYEVAFQKTDGTWNYPNRGRYANATQV